MEVYTTKEAKYISHDQRTQILLRPAMYIGNIEKKIYPTYIYDKKINKFVIKDIEYSEGFKRLFDEIITNATDYYLKKKSVKNIWVEVTDEYISVKNDNNGIEIIKTGNIYLPQRIYTVLNTSSNYDDNNEERKGSGMNGLGAKLTGLFSKKIILEKINFFLISIIASLVSFKTILLLISVFLKLYFGRAFIILRAVFNRL